MNFASRGRDERLARPTLLSRTREPRVPALKMLFDRPDPLGNWYHPRAVLILICSLLAAAAPASADIALPDLISDLAFYALGPERAASIASSGSGIDVSFRQLRQDVNYVIQASTNLTDWEVAASNPFGLGQEGTLRYNQPWDGGPDQMFYRVNVIFPGLGTTP